MIVAGRYVILKHEELKITIQNKDEVGHVTLPLWVT
jgi:hypothetical protein